MTVSGFGTPEADYRYRHKLPGGGFLGLGVAGKAWLEASLPHRVGTSNVTALPVPIALEALREAYREASSYCEPVTEHVFEESKVVRLDHVRDFDGVEHVPFLLDGLAGIRRDDVRWKVQRHQDAERNRAETLRVGPRAWAGTLYDKHAESPEFASPGRLRAEFRLHSAQLTSIHARNTAGHVRLVADLEQAKLDRFTRAMFERCAFDREVGAAASVAESVRTFDGVSERERSALWAYLTMPGFAASIHPNTERKYRRIAKSLGLAVGALELAESAQVVRLDFDRGTEVLRAA
jgi:hypothetical protein